MQAIDYATKYGWIYYFDALELVVVQGNRIKSLVAFVL